MATKSTQNQPIEDNIGSKAPIGPCGYIYVYNKENFPTNEASLLGNKHMSSHVVSIPLLYGLTVEQDFILNVKAIHKKLDASTIMVKVSPYHKEILFFHNVNSISPIFNGAGIECLCKEARNMFGFSSFHARSDVQTIKIEDLCPPHDKNPNNYLMAVAITETFKERLYYGHMIPVTSQTTKVQIGPVDAYKIPLYDRDLFFKIPSENKLKSFYVPELSQYLHDSLYTSLAQTLRLKNVDALIKAIEKQSIQDHHKMSKVVKYKDFSCNITKGQDSASLMIIDSTITELAISHGLAFMEAPQESCASLNYETWPIFSNCTTPQERIDALISWNAKQSIHIHAQLFSANSVLYINKIQKQNINSFKNDGNIFNHIFLQHGLANITEPTQLEDGTPYFKGVPESLLDGANYTIYHMAYAASFSPHLLARYCYYLQFCQHQRSTLNQSYDVKQYVESIISNNMCEICKGDTPTTCIQTLFYRLQDRFPPVTTTQRRDPYVVTGVSGPYNDLEYLGNFASFREKDEDATQKREEVQKYTYWQLNQTILDKLESMGIKDSLDETDNCITDIPSFLKIFKDIDAMVDTEVLKFINSMTKNNFNFRDSIKGIHHVLQYCCNMYWQPPCSVFLNLFYRSLITIIQDLCLPSCLVYEQENPSMGMLPSEWLKMHYHTLWTNFKSSSFDKGVITGSEIKIIHSDMFCDFFDLEAAANNSFVPNKVQVKLSKAIAILPKALKIKNRIVFSNSSATETVQNAFLKTPGRKDTYIVTGPYMKFLVKYHKTLFPKAKISSLYMWNMFSKNRKVPLIPGVSKDILLDLVNYIDANSQMHQEINVLDVVPDSITSYCKLKLNNTILRTCGQTQFYATTIHCLLPKIQMLPADEYPHVICNEKLSTPEDYQTNIQTKSALTIHSSQKENISSMAFYRPIFTVPIVVNKYTGLNGNNQIFHCGNMGYFVGRGVDKNLILDSSGYKKQGHATYMRKRHVFMTPIIDTLIKRVTTLGSVPFEIETTKKNILTILEEKDSDSVFNDIVLELVKSLGKNCENLTPDDLAYYMGPYYIMSDEVTSRLQTLIDSSGPWTQEWASSILEQTTEDLENIEFVGFENSIEASITTEDSFLQIGGPVNSGRKRKINNILNEIDL